MSSVTKNEKPCLLVGDIGGTNVRFALADSRRPGYSQVTSYQCVDFASADEAIETYLEQCPVDVNEKPQGVEVEVECDLGVHGLPPLFGIIDLVRPGGVIVDYKTAARSPNVKLAAHQHETQLGCYALMYREATGEDESGFELHHLIKTKEPKIMVTVLGPMSPALEIQIYRLIDDYLAGIAAERWIPSPGQHCGWCDYLEECRACTTCATGKGGVA